MIFCGLCKVEVIDSWEEHMQSEEHQRNTNPERIIEAYQESQRQIMEDVKKMVEKPNRHTNKKAKRGLRIPRKKEE